MGIVIGVRLGHENPGGHTHIGGQRLSIRPADRQPSPIYRHCSRTNAACHDCRKGERRHHEADARFHQATIGPKWTRISTSLGMNGHWCRGFKNEPTKSTIVATKAFPPRQDGHLGAHMPRRSAGQKTPLIVGWHLPNAFQVQFDTGGQRRFRILEGRAVGGDIQVGTDRMPLVATLSSVTSQCEVHDSSLGSTCEVIVRRDQRTIGSFRLPEPLCVAWGIRRRTV